VICPHCAGRLLLNDACGILRDDPENQLALVVAGIAARLARTPHEPLPVALPARPEGWADPLPSWLRLRFAPPLAAAAGLASEADGLRTAADDELQQLSDAHDDERAVIGDGQLIGGCRARL
jgi:hypothetical protein